MNNYIAIGMTLLSSILGFIVSYYVIRKRNKKSFEPDYIRAQFELQNGNYDLSLEYFKDVLSNIRHDSPFFISSLVGVSEVYMAKKDYKNAMKFINKAIKASETKQNKLLKRQIQKLRDKISAMAQMTK